MAKRTTRNIDKKAVILDDSDLHHVDGGYRGSARVSIVEIDTSGNIVKQAKIKDAFRVSPNGQR